MSVSSRSLRPSALVRTILAGEPPADREASRLRVSPLAFLAIALQLVLALLVIDAFQIETRAFGSMMALALGAFCVHAWLPWRWRLPLFVTVSLFGFALVLGPFSGAWVVGIGLGLVGLCHAPLPFATRVALLVAVGLGLAVLRAGWLPHPWSAAIWPVLGSVFMFRLILYLYDLRHAQAPRTFWRVLAYFFMLPNPCFALFPVIDPKTFDRRYYDEDAARIYQVGVQWIARGVVHLLLYRFLYYNVVIAPEEVASGADFLRYAVSNFALYLRVSGVFHVVIGTLRLFGFNLPETHLFYFFSSSVNDFWRRINIYWKDFMLKVFYYPAFFRLRKRSAERALVLATLYVVVVTWFFHSYQWFWLRGSFPVKWQDILFWGALGLLMIANSLYETRHARARGRRARAWTPSNALGNGLRIAGTFGLICLLWSLWTVESFDEWVGLWSWVREGRLVDARGGGSSRAGAPLCLALVALAALARGGAEGGRRLARPRRLVSIGLQTGFVLASLLVLSRPAVYTRLGDDLSRSIQELRVVKLNRIDAMAMEGGYYEDLLNVERFNSELWQQYGAKPLWWLELHQTTAMERTTDFDVYRLKPFANIVYKNAPLAINRWGMRDVDLTLEKPPRTCRVAFVGASYVMGAGVDREETFVVRFSERLNEHASDGIRFEVMNFGVAGYAPLQRLYHLEKRVLRFDPDVVAYVAHENEFLHTKRHLRESLAGGIEPPYPWVRALLGRLAIGPALSDFEIERRLLPHDLELVDWTYRRFREAVGERAAVWIYLPTLDMYGQRNDVAPLEALARDAGFETLNLVGVYDGHDIFAIRIAHWDNHPNAVGHQLIADRLYELYRANPRLASACPGSETRLSQRQGGDA